MKFGVLCFVVAAFGNVKGVLSPVGEHVCMFDEKYVDIIQVRELVPVKVYKIEWCWRVPPRCTVESQTYKPTLVNREIPRVRIVPRCCKGYEEVVAESKCVPVCSEPCLNGDCIGPEKCSCVSGYGGDRCEKPCESGTWGRGCLEKCDCRNNATCDGVHGECTCSPGWKGVRCDSPCEQGHYGVYCEHRCNCDGRLCDPVTGECETVTELTLLKKEEDTEMIYETTTETEDLTNSTEYVVETMETELQMANNVEMTEENMIDLEGENSTALVESSTLPNLVRVDLEDVKTEQLDNINETVEDNEIEHSRDFSFDFKKREFNLFSLLENFSIICGIFILIFVITMSSVMVSHYRKIRKTGFDSKKSNNSNSQNFPIHRFYGGSILPARTILENQICTTNVDLQVEQPKMMTFKPLPDEKRGKEYFVTSEGSNKGHLNNMCNDLPPNSTVPRNDHDYHASQFEYDEPRSIPFVPMRLKHV